MALGRLTFHVNVNAKSFPSRKAYRMALISVSLALSQTPVYIAKSPIWGWCIRCIRSQLSLVLVALIHGGVARLS